MHSWHLKWLILRVLFLCFWYLDTILISIHLWYTCMKSKTVLLVLIPDVNSILQSHCSRHVHTFLHYIQPVLCVKAILSLKSKWFSMFFFSSLCLPPVHIQHEGQVPGKLPTRPQQQQLRSKLEEHCLLSLQSKATPHPRLVPTAQTSFTPGLPI